MLMSARTPQVATAIGGLAIVAAIALLAALRHSTKQQHLTTSIIVDATTHLPAAIPEPTGSSISWRTRFIADDIQRQREKPPAGPTADDERGRIMYYQSCVQYGIARHLRDTLRIPISDQHVVFANVAENGKVRTNDQPHILGAGDRRLPPPPRHASVRVASHVTLSQKTWIDLPIELTDPNDPDAIGASIVRLIDPGRFQLVFVIRAPGRGGRSREPRLNRERGNSTYTYAVTIRYDISPAVALRGHSGAYQRWLGALLSDVRRKWADDSEFADRRLTSR